MKTEQNGTLFFLNLEKIHTITTEGKGQRFFRSNEGLHGESSTESEHTLQATSLSESPLLSINKSSKTLYRYSPYGYEFAMLTARIRLGFNGELYDPASACYILGNGYRLFNPAILRFSASDNLSPFDGGGLNSYCYCANDPINNTDRSGHVSTFIVKRSQQGGWLFSNAGKGKQILKTSLARTESPATRLESMLRRMHHMKSDASHNDARQYLDLASATRNFNRQKQIVTDKKTLKSLGLFQRKYRTSYEGYTPTQSLSPAYGQPKNPDPANHTGLTQRELDYMGLSADELTNREQKTLRISAPRITNFFRNLKKIREAEGIESLR